MLDGEKASVNSEERGMFVIRLQHLMPAHLNELFITVTDVRLVPSCQDVVFLVF